MAEIVNLRRARKDRQRREREAEADANRRRFGRTRAEKTADRDASERAKRDIDGALVGGASLDPDQFSDAELLDAIYYSVFPNWSPWGTFNVLFYRWRPNGNNPDESIFEVMMFVPWKDQEHRPTPAAVTRLGIDDDWTMAPELGATAKIFQQDSINLPQVQRGLKAMGQDEIVFANYNETKIRHFWEHLYHWLEIGETKVSETPVSFRPR